MWVYILTGVTFVTSLAMLGILIYSLVELGKLSFDNSKKKKERAKAEEERKLLEMERRIQSYVEYKQRKIAEQNKEDYNKKEEI